MSYQKMTRQQSKFIYDYLPYNTFNHAHCNISGRIMSLYHKRDERNEKVDPGVPKAYLIQRLHARISKWPNDEEVRDDLTYADTQLVVPNGAGFHLYPRTFECEACDSITTFSNDNDIEPAADANVDSTSLAVCHNCGARVTDSDQLPFVGVCECGGINEMWVPECCDVGMQLDRETSAMGDWMWVCAKGNCDEGSGGSRNRIPFFAIGTNCPEGGCDNEEMDIINHTASRAFYPQVYNLVNATPRLDDLYDNPRFRAQIVSDYMLGENDTGPSDHEIRQEANDILGGGSAIVQEAEEEVEDAMEQARDRLSLDVQQHREETHQWLQNRYDGDPTELAENLYEYLSVVHPDYAPEGGIESTSYQEMEDNNANDTHLDLAVVKQFNQLRKDLSLDEIRLIKNFPITTVTYGYTRLSSEPPEHQRNAAIDNEDVTELVGQQGEEGSEGEDDEDSVDERDVELNLFNRGPNAEPQLYVQNNDAEAVLVKFDKETVIQWLQMNGVLTDDGLIPDTGDSEELRGWFLEHVQVPARYDELPDHGVPNTDETIARHCYTLLNTMAHLFINGMGALAGHQRESLVERLLPYSMAFVVYKRPDTDFQLGSLWTLFEEQFDDFTEHLEELNDCSFDPVCMHDENGACEDCLYLAAISTQNANHNLGRATFFGGPFDTYDSQSDSGHSDLTGYRDV
jgi:hypothetical protein